MKVRRPLLPILRAVAAFLCVWGTAFSSRAATVSFAWTENTEPDLAGYKLYFGPASRTYTNYVVLGKVGTYALSNLVNGATYYFAITAYNSNNLESALSDELRYPNAPVLGEIADGTTLENTPISIPLVVTDVDTPLSNLTLSAVSSNLVLVPATNMSFSGTGSNRSMTITPAAGRSGSAGILVTVSDGVLAASRSFVLTVTAAPSKLAMWRSSYFSASDLQDPGKESTVWGDLADPDSDGRPNLMEFALGLDPLGSEPQESVFTTAVVKEGGNHFLTLTFRSRLGEPSLQYIPEVSADHAAWTATAQRTGNAQIDAEFELVTYQDTVPIPSGGARFVRLRVVRTSL